jgi:hypothetical protein
VCTGVRMTAAQRKSYVNNELTKAVAVFVGRVVITDPLKATLAVTDVWKGDLPPVLTLPTGTRVMPGGVFVSSSCDWPYHPGQRYLVFAYGSSLQDMRARYCTPTTELEFAAKTISILDELAPRKMTVPKSSGRRE